MQKLIQMPLEGEAIIVEVEVAEDEIVPVSKTGQLIVNHVERSFEKLEGVITKSCSVLIKGLKNMAEKEPTIDTASFEFGLRFTGEGNIYMVKTATQGSIKVMVNLRLK